MGADRFLLRLSDQLALAFEPLRESLLDAGRFSALIERHGWLAPPDTLDIGDIQGLFDIGADLDQARTLISETTQASEEQLLELLPQILDALKRVITTLKRLSTLRAQPLPYPFNVDEFWRQFPTSLLEDLFANYLNSYFPTVFSFLLFVGTVEEQSVSAGGAAGRTDYMRRTIHWDRLSGLVAPADLAKTVYGWGTARFDYGLLLSRLAKLLNYLGLTADLYPPSTTFLDEYYDAGNPVRSQVYELRLPIVGGTDEGGQLFRAWLSLIPIPDSGTPSGEPVGIAVGPSISGTLPAMQFGDVGLTLTGGFELDQGIRLEIRPDATTPRLVSLGATTLDAELALRYAPTRPLLLIGSEGSHRLQLLDLSTGVHALGAIDDLEFKFTFAVDRLEVVIDNSEADGFLQRIFGSDPQTMRGGGAIDWSSKTGVHFRGSVGFTLVIPLNVTILIVALDTLRLTLEAVDTALALTAAITGRAALGPVTASVQNIGVRLGIVPIPAGQPPGTFGNVDLTFGFKPPDGLGITVDAGPVVGGGFITFDPVNGRYSGLLQLQIYSIAVTAFGLLDTRLPDGRPEVSFVIAISIDIPDIQIGFGFVLSGFGGLVGINRTVVIDALQTSVRNGTAGNILFPPIPVPDPPRLISDLRAIFPAAEGRFVFGPLAKIAWGTPHLVEGKLGIILEVPEPIRLILIGQINALLPEKDAAIVELHIDILGFIDFGQKLFGIDSTLHDSRVVAFSLYGDMAMRLSWAEPPNFALSIGGWNPHFQPPAGFPTLRRLTVALGAGDNPRITLQGYFALTSNSAQVGAQAELYAGAGGFSVYGWIGFDALFIFSPFSFRTDFSAGVALRHDSSTIASIHLSATLTGPSPFHAWGEACLSILFFDVCVGFDATFGETQTVTLPPANPWSKLQEALQAPANWSATLPPGAVQVVALKPPPGPNPPVILDPVGSATVHEKVVPLNQPISKFGESALEGPSHYNLTAVTVGATAASWTKAQDFFARGQFQDLSDAQKLSLPSYEQMDAGASVASAAVDPGAPIGTDVTYETIIIDTPYESRSAPRYGLPLAHQQTLIALAAAALSPLKQTGFARFAPDPRDPQLVTLDSDDHVVVSTDDMTPRPDITGPTTKGKAHDKLDAYLETHPAERGRVRVAAAYETEMAAV